MERNHWYRQRHSAVLRSFSSRSFEKMQLEHRLVDQSIHSFCSFQVRPQHSSEEQHVCVFPTRCWCSRRLRTTLIRRPMVDLLVHCREVVSDGYQRHLYDAARAMEDCDLYNKSLLAAIVILKGVDRERDWMIESMSDAQATCTCRPNAPTSRQPLISIKKL